MSKENQDRTQGSTLKATAALVAMWCLAQIGGGIRGDVRKRTGQLITIALAIIFVVVGTLVAAEMSGPFFDAIGALAENFTNPNTGIALIDALGPILALVIGVVLLFGLVLAIIRLGRFN